jgi:hypothetical protein
MFWILVLIGFGMFFRLGFKVGSNLFKPGGWLK